MRLYLAADTEYAQHVVKHGFIGVDRPVDDGAEIDTARAKTHPRKIKRNLPQPISSGSYVEFRDIPPTGLDFSRTTEPEAVDDAVEITISGGPVLAGVGDFVLSIEVPNEIALKHIITEDPILGWPFHEIWLPPAVANEHLATLKAFDFKDGGEVRLDLIGK